VTKNDERDHCITDGEIEDLARSFEDDDESLLDDEDLHLADSLPASLAMREAAEPAISPVSFFEILETQRRKVEEACRRLRKMRGADGRPVSRLSIESRTGLSNSVVRYVWGGGKPSVKAVIGFEEGGLIGRYGELADPLDAIEEAARITPGAKVA